MGKPKIDSEEWKIISVIAIISVLWIMLGIPFVTSDPNFTNLPPPAQFIFFNIGFAGICVAMFGSAITFIQKKKYDFVGSIKNGIGVWAGFSLMLDNITPPYAIDLHGNYAISTIGTGVQSSVDYALAWMINLVLPQLQGMELFGVSLLVFAVYAVVPLVTLMVGAYILSNGEFSKRVSKKWYGSKG